MKHLLQRILGSRKRNPNEPASPDESKATVGDILACFRLLLGRPPNPEEWEGHSSRAGQELEDIVKSFLQSQEFAARRLLAPTRFNDWQVAHVNGVEIVVYPEDIDIGRAVLAGHYEPHVSRLFEREIKSGMRVLDVGANCGFFTFLAARLVGVRGYVIAVEPNMSNLRLLEMGRRKNGFDHVELLPFAAASRAGIAILHASHTNGMTNALSEVDEVMDSTLVCQMPLDGVVEPVDFIKIDVEGQELDALRGFSRGLKSRPKIVSEFSPNMLRNAVGEDYLRFLFDHGYQAGMIETDGLVPSFTRNPSILMKAFAESGVDHIDIFAVPT